MRSDHRLPQRVVRALESHRTQIDHTVHERHGGTGGEKLPEQLPVRTEILLPGHHIPVMTVGINAGQDSRNRLGCNRRQRGAADAHSESCNKEKVQGNIQQACEDQEVKRRPAVPERAKDPGKHIIGNGCRHSGTDDCHIAVCLVEDAFRGIHQPHQGRKEHQGKARQQHGDGCVQDHHAADGLSEFPFIVCTEGLGNHHRKTAVQPH